MTGVQAQIDSGAYTKHSEVLRDLIRKAQQENSAIEAIRAGASSKAQRKAASVLRGPEEISRAVKEAKPLNVIRYH